MKIFILTVLSVSLTLANSQTTDRTTIIIGAGLSGYSAARRLMENGFNDIVILEASGRIGGRVESVPFNGGMIDLGAQWVHGQGGNSIYSLVSPHFQFGSTPFDSVWPNFVLSNGTTPTQNNFRSLYTLGHSILEQVYNIGLIRQNIGSLFLSRFNTAMNNATYNHIDEATRELMRQDMHKNVNGYFASSSWFDLSARLNWLLEATSGNQHLTWRRQGFQTVFDYITRKLPNSSQYLNIDSKVRLNKRVTSIRYNTNDPNSRTTVVCSDGTVFSARHVIFTGSVSVLRKYHTTLFTPALPATKVRSINNIAMGNVGKFFMEFDSPWWVTRNVPFLQFSLMWSEAHKSLARSTNRAYLIDIVAVYGVDQFPNVLQVFFSGSNIREMELATNSKVLDDIMWMLDLFLPQFRPIPKPRNVLKTKWETDENFLGSYTYQSTTQETNSATIADLASTIRASNGMPTLLFAGEATNTRFASMAHGAVDSGTRVADEIIAFHR